LSTLQCGRDFDPQRSCAIGNPAHRYPMRNMD
jgi:hypothetical protein